MPNRLLKQLSRQVRVAWREQLTQQDVEALQANVDRVGLVIALRWALVAALALFSLLALAFYAPQMRDELLGTMLVPSVTLVFVLAYNTYYRLTYRHLGNISVLNHAQLMFDVLVVSVLVYYSGGVYSWFHAMYLLFILEAAFILPRNKDVWLVAFVAMACYGVILGAEYFGLLPHVDVPFVQNDLHLTGPYVAVRFLWGVTMMSGTATIASVLMERIRRREAELAEGSLRDEMTGLCKRAEFQRVLEMELGRAARNKRVLTVILADLDGFASFNKLFGLEGGDRMLCMVADAIRETVDNDAEETSAVPHAVCRYGGEEFAVLVTEEHDTPAGKKASVAHAEGLAERIRVAVSGLRLRDGSVTASLGVASYPMDGITSSDLLGAADKALSAATEAGGNRIATARALELAAADA